MTTLNTLKQALHNTASPLPLLQSSESEWKTYQDFIIPHLTNLLTTHINLNLNPGRRISILEIGPGPRSILGSLPYRVREGIGRYVAVESSGLSADELDGWLGVEKGGVVRRVAFQGADADADADAEIGEEERFDVVLFCHNLYGMKPKAGVIKRALGMLVEKQEQHQHQQKDGIVVVFHRDLSLQLDGLVCHQTASFPTGFVSVEDTDDALDRFASFVAGVHVDDDELGTGEAIRGEWRNICRELGGRHHDQLYFNAPNVMAVFNRHATALPELTSLVPSSEEDRVVKNREARLHQPAAVVRPTEIRHVQDCVRWALRHGVGLTVLGGGHSGHCLWSGVVSVDMNAFDRVHVLAGGGGDDVHSLVVAGAGCKSGDIVRESMAAGVTVPLGARPSVGAGLWLQGGIGHLSRMYGLACDAIIGAVMVSVDTGQVLCIGHVPSQHSPDGAVRPENEDDLLWAIKGAGTSVGIVVSVVFKAYAAPTYSVRNWVVPMDDIIEAGERLEDFNNLVAGRLGRSCSADAYLYWDGRLHFGVTMFAETSDMGRMMPPGSFKTVDSVGLFEADMYMSYMHGGGHGNGKTSSFKRCVFLKDIGSPGIADILVAAVECRPSQLCYLHLLHGGGAISDVPANATAFGCRDWDFACVITGVWPRDQDGTEVARATVQWVYNVAGDLLPLCCGVYNADLGPDPRDAVLAAKAFGPNRRRLARLKRCLDPQNVLAYTCPLPVPTRQKLIILVTGECGAGKDYCAGVWVSAFRTWVHDSLVARAVSISDATKREYAAATGADLDGLLRDRAYKEQHRPALTAFFSNQVQLRPRLPEEHFLEVLRNAGDVDVVLVTGMRDEAPVARFSYLVPDSRVIEVRVNVSEETRRARRGCGNDDSGNLEYRPSFTFNNDSTGSEAAEEFAENHLLPFFHEDLQRLTNMVRPVPDFPRPGIEFRHVLNIVQQPGGLRLCMTLLETHFNGDWDKTDVIACCEAGGFIFASALASRVNIPLALIREAGKLPQPTVSAQKATSHISSASKSLKSSDSRIEVDRDVIPRRGGSVVVADDVLATGKTLCAVLQLLVNSNEPGGNHLDAGDVSVLVVAEFPFHRGRELLRQHGFGRVNVQSLLVFDDA